MIKFTCPLALLSDCIRQIYRFNIGKNSVELQVSYSPLINPVVRRNFRILVATNDPCLDDRNLGT